MNSSDPGYLLAGIVTAFVWVVGCIIFFKREDNEPLFIFPGILPGVFVVALAWPFFIAASLAVGIGGIIYELTPRRNR